MSADKREVQVYSFGRGDLGALLQPDDSDHSPEDGPVSFKEKGWVTQVRGEKGRGGWVGGVLMSYLFVVVRRGRGWWGAGGGSWGGGREAGGGGSLAWKNGQIIEVERDGRNGGERSIYHIGG